MTRKRYIKLKMAEGLSRNEATRRARTVAVSGGSYQEDFDFCRLIEDFDDLQRKIAEQLPDMVSFCLKMIPVIVEKMVVALPEIIACWTEAMNDVCDAISAERLRQDTEEMKE